MATAPSTDAPQLFPTSKYVWPNLPATTEEAKHMVWLALFKGREAFLSDQYEKTRKSYSKVSDILPTVNSRYDNHIGVGTKASGWLKSAAADMSGASSGLFLDNQKLAETLYATADKLIAAGKAASTPAVAPAATTPSTPAVATESSGTYLQRLMADPLATIKETFANPWVLSGTVVVVGGLLYWFVLREPEATLVRANKKKKNHYGKRHIARERGEEVEVESEEEIEEEVVPKKRATKSNRRSLKNRRHGRK